MARKEEHEKEPNHERWLVSYADFITLLFAVFVTLYAMSQTDKKKIEEVMESMRESFGYHKSSPASKPSVIESGTMSVIPGMRKISMNTMKKGKGKGGEKDFRATKSSIDAYLMKVGAQDKVGVTVTQRGLVVSLREAGFFDSGSATLKKSAYSLLNDVMETLASYSNAIRVEGHTDNVPMNSSAFPSNWELSTARATNVVHYLTRSDDFDPGSVSAAGYAQYRPVADNATEEGRRKNRRVDLVLLSEESERSEPEKVGPAPAQAPAPQVSAPQVSALPPPAAAPVH